MKLNEAGAIARPVVTFAGALAVMVKVTGSGAANPQALAVALTEPLYEPGARPVGFAETVSAPVVVPVKGLTDSHPPLLVAVAENSPAAPPQISETVCEGGAAPPAEAVNDSDPAPNDSPGVTRG